MQDGGGIVNSASNGLALEAAVERPEAEEPALEHWSLVRGKGALARPIGVRKNRYDPQQ